MNNKQSGAGAGVGSSMNAESPSPPPSTLCFPSRRSSSSSTSGDKKPHNHHQYDDPYQNIGLCGCHRTSKSRCVSAIGVLILLLTYTAMGSILFVTLEGEEDLGKTVETAVAASKPRTDLVNADIRSRTVDRLWSITEDLNILYKENWTRLAAKEVQEFQDMLLRSVRATKIQQTGIQPSIKPHKWTYASAFLYSITLITTIGYGGISIKTHTRIAALVYALFGIPLVLLYLSVMGDGLSTIMRCLFRRLRTCGTKRNRSESTSSQSSGNNSNSSSSTGIGTINGRTDNGTIIDKSFHNASMLAPSLKAAKLSKANQNYDNNYSNQMYNYTYYQHTNGVPVSISVMILICYITLGAALFHRIQTWNVLESLYFCFTSLGTIGFGELEPKGNIAQYAASAYILIGMAIVAMCFNLIRSEIVMWLRRFDGEHSEEKSHASNVSGPGNGRNVGAGISQNSFAHMMPHHNHLMHQLPSGAGPIEDVALVTVAVTPKS